MKTIAIGLWAAQVLTAVAMSIAVWVDVESIVFTGPVLSVVGIALAIFTQRLRSWATLLFSLSGPLICALGAFLIAVFHLGPPEAQAPIAGLMTIYLLTAIPAAVIALREILDWDVDSSRQDRWVWRYSMKSLLVVMTGACVLVAVGQWVAGVPLLDFPIVFGAFACATIALSGAVVWRWRAKRAPP